MPIQKTRRGRAPGIVLRILQAAHELRSDEGNQAYPGLSNRHLSDIFGQWVFTIQVGMQTLINSLPGVMMHPTGQTR